MNPSISKRLALCNSLPSIPAAATRIVELARDPSAGMREVAEVVRTDPALAAKVLRMANSPLYARRRRCESFQQALVLLGLNATLSLALTFSLANALKDGEAGQLDYERVWRRALLSATAARVLGSHFGLKDVEDLFLAGLLQDIGMLALDRGYPQLYAGLDADAQSHDRIRVLERGHLGVDHSQVGAWLLERWSLPSRLVDAVRASHGFDAGEEPSESSRFNQAVALSGKISDVWMSKSPDSSLRDVQLESVKISGLHGDALMSVLEAVAVEAPEIESMFELELFDQQRSEWVLAEAREMLVFRNLQMVQESTQLREAAATLKAQAVALEERSKRDNLTGAYNRGFLDATLVEWFAESDAQSKPLSLIFIDLDDFKQVNDRYGHHEGDRVLTRFAESLHYVARTSDLVARYGGEEFVILLRDCCTVGARRICERLLEQCRAIRHELESGQRLRISASLGVATHGELVLFGNAMEMMRAADEALYKAKQLGKDRFVEHGLAADAA